MLVYLRSDPSIGNMAKKVSVDARIRAGVWVVSLRCRAPIPPPSVRQRGNSKGLPGG